MKIVSIFILLQFILFQSCNEGQRTMEGDHKSVQSIEFFYTDFYANHNGEKLFDSTLYKSYDWMTFKENNKKIDSIDFDEIYNRLITLKIDTNDGLLDYFGIYYQFIIKENDSIKRLLVLNNDNYFSTDGIKFVRNDTLAFQLKGIIAQYQRFTKEKRKVVFKEYDLFNLDTIPYIPRETLLNDYVYFRGRFIRQ